MIVVTGAAGVLGRALMLRARQLGLDVCGIARRVPREPIRDMMVCDLAECPSLPESIDALPSVVIHLAAAVPHSRHYPDTEASAAITRRIDRCVHAAAEQWRCHVIYASTCGLYDRSSGELKCEDSDHLIRLASPYFAAKFEGEQRFSALGRCTVLRLPAPIGRGIPVGLVASRFVAQSLAGETLNVWGSGQREQDFVDKQDLVEAVLAAARVCWPGVVNIASGRPVTMLDLARRVVAVVGRGQVLLTGQSDPRDAETARYSTDRAQQVLQWTAHTPLDDSIRSLADEIRDGKGAV